MKHTVTVLTIFLSLFILAQVAGLYFIGLSVSNITKETTPTGEEISQVVFANTSVGERPQVQGYESLIYIAIGVIIGTILLLIIAKFGKIGLWQIWFFLAAALTISITAGVLTGEKLFWLSWVIGGALALLKMLYRHPIVHNVTELLMYIGIAVLLAPILSVWIAILLLILIALYDAYAVWKSKHMITLAEFTRKANLFPGLSLNYIKKKDKTIILGSETETHTANKEHKSKERHEEHSHVKKGMKTGVLGGGDVVFPMLFAGAVFIHLIGKGHTMFQALALSTIISLFAAIALALLFYFGKKDRFYPAMPFISAGCFVGYGVMSLVMMI
jgi:presenilin-like A22 family membrane protease